MVLRRVESVGGEVRWRNTASAMGERHMFPRQTKRMERGWLVSGGLGGGSAMVGAGTGCERRVVAKVRYFS